MHTSAELCSGLMGVEEREYLQLRNITNVIYALKCTTCACGHKLSRSQIVSVTNCLIHNPSFETSAYAPAGIILAFTSPLCTLLSQTSIPGALEFIGME